MTNKFGYPKEIEKPKIKIEYREAMSRMNIIGFTCGVLVILAIIVVTALCCDHQPARAEEYSNEAIASAIYKAENSVKFPYGIKSINTNGNKEYARKICLNTIRNHKKRHAKHDCGLDFISCLGNRYCPPTAHSLNKNWVRLVKGFLTNEAHKTYANLQRRE